MSTPGRGNGHSERNEIGAQLIVDILRGREMTALRRYAECVISSLWMKDIVEGLQDQWRMIGKGVRIGDDSSRKILLLSTGGLGMSRTGRRLVGHIRNVSWHWHKGATAVRTKKVMGVGVGWGSAMCSGRYSERRTHSPSSLLTSQSAPSENVYQST